MEKIRQEKTFGVERLSALCYGIPKGLNGFLLEDLNVKEILAYGEKTKDEVCVGISLRKPGNTRGRLGYLKLGTRVDGKMYSPDNFRVQLPDRIDAAKTKLTVIGYKLADRLNGLDFQHAEVAIKGLADFHALSLALIERGDLIPRDYASQFYVNNPGIVESLASAAIPELIRVIEEEWKGEWLSYAGKLREFLKTATSRFIDEIRISDNDFNVLVHGDYWMCNMLFRHDADGVPLNNRILDFQICQYANAAIDLQYFLHTSLNADTLLKKEELLKVYYESLKYFLSLYGVSEKTPTFEDFLESCEKLKVFSLVIGLGYQPFVMQPAEKIVDKEEWMKRLNENEVMSPNLQLGDIERLLKIMLKYGSKIGIF